MDNTSVWIDNNEEQVSIEDISKSNKQVPCKLNGKRSMDIKNYSYIQK